MPLHGAFVACCASIEKVFGIVVAFSSIIRNALVEFLTIEVTNHACTKSH
jgi:hypothetical protein